MDVMVLWVICEPKNSLDSSRYTPCASIRITAKTRSYLESASFLLGQLLSSNEKQYKKRVPRINSGTLFCTAFRSNSYRFENCGARLAALRPYFLRSFIRGSRVKKPAALSVGRYSPST